MNASQVLAYSRQLEQKSRELEAASAELRAAIGDDAQQPRVIQTIIKRGYRLIAPVEEGSDGSGAPGARNIISGNRNHGIHIVGALATGNIVQGIDVGESNGIHYFAMEFVDGASLKDLLHSSGRPPLGAT